MQPRPPSPLVLKAFACLLALLAGGDDFNLARAALPALFPPAPSDALPLDDPNTDAVKSAASEVPPDAGQDGSGCRRPFPQAVASPLASTRDGPPPHLPLNPPLRC
jgi:hypothetical protein